MKMIFNMDVMQKDYAKFYSHFKCTFRKKSY